MVKIKLLKITALICCGLLFIGGPGHYAQRSFGAAWNTGHIFLFAILTYLAMHYLRPKISWTYLNQCFVFIVCGTAVGVLIELLQKFVGRDLSYVDVANDLTGILLACAFLVPNRKTLPKTRLQFLQMITLLALFFSLYPLSTALLDEYVEDTQFPVLADFETPFELKRWTDDHSSRSIDHALFRHGNASMKVELNTSKYSGTSLAYFPHDWSGYRLLRFSIYNPSEQPLKIHCRVHDKQYSLNGSHYYDRFKASFTALHGWNDFEIPLEDIMNGPKNRKMMLHDIRRFGFFVVQLPKPQVIFVDHVRLEQ